MAEIQERKRLAKLQYEIELLTIDRYDLQLCPFLECADPIQTFYYKAVRDNKLGFIEHEIKRLNIELEFGKLRLKNDPMYERSKYNIQEWLDKQNLMGIQRPPSDPTSS
jgi:hypothetical protein